MNAQALSPDTEVVLLLCGRFGGERSQPHAPLTPREYGDLAKWLAIRESRPMDLLGEQGSNLLAFVHESRLEPQRLAFLLARGTAMALAMERWSRAGVWVISRGDPEFPKRLKQRLRHAAPPLLYGSGNKALLDSGGVAIVGSRHASENALAFTRDVAECCASQGLAVVSGGARGVDAAAMQAATESGGLCIGVLAADLLKTSMHKQNRMGLQSGRMVLVSPFYPEAGFNAGHAMGRNRYIYALADYGLVIDADLKKGGTWEGAVENLNHQWVPLFVRTPGEGHGNAVLVSQGAAPFDESDLKARDLANHLAERVTRDRSFELALERQQLVLVAEPEPMYQLDDALQSLPLPVGGSSEPVGPSQAKDSMDMYQDFTAHLSVVFSAGPLSEEDVAMQLGLDKSQIRTWIKRACETGVLEKLKRPVRYVLGKQSTLC